MSEEEKIIDFWEKSAEEDLKTAEVLFLAKKNLPCLFFCHLALEKILKAIFVKKKHSAPPLVHDLLKLSQELGLKTDKIKEDLREISRFNIAARYDDYKFSMYKKANVLFTKKYFEKTKEINKWLKEQR